MWDDGVPGQIKRRGYESNKLRINLGDTKGEQNKENSRREFKEKIPGVV
jgi:hypothetical protein